jgi:hypothetical protein
MEEHTGIWSVQEFQDALEACVRRGYLPQPIKTEWAAELTYKAYREVNNKYAKLALLVQLAGILAELRLRNPTKRFECICAKAGIEKPFAQKLLVAYTNPKERWELGNA